MLIIDVKTVIARHSLARIDGIRPLHPLLHLACDLPARTATLRLFAGDTEELRHLDHLHDEDTELIHGRMLNWTAASRPCVPCLPNYPVLQHLELTANHWLSRISQHSSISSDHHAVRIQLSAPAVHAWHAIVDALHTSHWNLWTLPGGNA